MKVTQEPDRVLVRPVVIGGVGFVGIIMLGVALAWGLERIAEGPRPEIPVARLAGRGWNTPETDGEVNGMRTSLFPRPERVAAEPGRPVTPSRLSEYGWVDRERGVVHVPIERAKELYLERQRRHAAVNPSPGTPAGDER
jgi:hypothetical protein